jgi:hypothetical protein
VAPVIDYVSRQMEASEFAYLENTEVSLLDLIRAGDELLQVIGVAVKKKK